MAPQDKVDVTVPTPSSCGPSAGTNNDTSINTGSPATVSFSRGDNSTPVFVTVKQCLLVVCCFLMLMNVLGFLAGLGVLFVEIIDTFQSTRAMGSLVQSVCTGIVFGTGAVTSPLITMVGAGRVCIIGGLVAAAGLVGSAFAPNLPVLIFTVGVVTGCGLCTTSMVPLILVGEVFDKRRNLALTIVSVGPGVGGLVFPVLNSVLVDVFGWRGAFLILGGITLQATPMGMILAVIRRDIKAFKESKKLAHNQKALDLECAAGEPGITQLEGSEGLEINQSKPSEINQSQSPGTNQSVSSYKHVTIHSQNKQETNSYANPAFLEDSDQRAAKSDCVNGFHNCKDTNLQSMTPTDSDNVAQNQSRWRSLLSSLHLELFTQLSFVVLAVNVVLITALFPSLNFFLVDMTISKGFDAKTGSFLLSLIGFCNLAGRILYLFIRPLLKVSQVAIFATVGGVVSLTVLILVWADTYTTLLVAVICYGLPFGGVSVSYPSLMFEIAGPERYSSAVGYSETLSGLGALIGGPTAGSLKDWTDSYDTVVFCATAAGLFCSLSFYAVLIRRRCGQTKVILNKETACTHM